MSLRLDKVEFFMWKYLLIHRLISLVQFLMHYQTMLGSRFYKLIRIEVLYTVMTIKLSHNINHDTIKCNSSVLKMGTEYTLCI